MNGIDFTDCPRVLGRAYIYSFPCSMLKQDGRKINYHQFLHNCDDPQFLTEYHALVPRILALDIETLLHQVPYLTDLHHRFLSYYLRSRRQALFENLR